MTESLIQSEPFPRDICMFVIIVVKIDSNTLSMSLSFIIISAFQFEDKDAKFCLIIFFF